VRSNNHSRQSRLSDLKARIDAGRTRLNMIESRLQPVTNELGSLKGRLETLASELKSLDRQHNAGLQIDIDDYNAKVKTHNALLSEHRALIAANSSDFQLYEELARQDKELVAQYNALLK
jgi:predicted  nucleic acid-binding Zn-ribbon protein